jgi:hypothetical protein
MASGLNLTSEDVSVIEQRLVETKMGAWASGPQRPPLTGWQKEAADKQAAKLVERRAAARAEEERLCRQRARAAERRRAEFEANAPKRQQAKIELAEIGREIEALDAQQERLWERARELEQEAKR